MPSKFPKVFQKRKSSGDVLEDVRPVSSFRVLERPAENTTVKPFDTRPSLGMRRKTNELRPMSEGNIDNMAAQQSSHMNRGSGGTQKSNSSYGAYDTASSGRYSSTSTLPSSVDGVDEYANAITLRPSKTTPSTPVDGNSTSGFFKSAGRKFSFGGKKSLQAAEAAREELAMRSPPVPVQSPPMPHHDRALYAGVHDLHLSDDLPALPSLPSGRARATTETSYASESTITMGRSAAIDKLEVRSSADDDDGFGDLFAGIGEERRKSKTLDATITANLGKPLTENKNYAPYRPNNGNIPPPLNLSRHSKNDSVTSPPMDSSTSADGLIVASPKEERSLFNALGGSTATAGRSATVTAPSDAPTSPTRQGRPRRQSRGNSRNLLPRRESEHFEDTDALLVSKSNSSKNSPSMERDPPSYRDNLENTSSFRSTPLIAATAIINPSANPWTNEQPPPVPSHSSRPVVQLSPHSTADDEDGVDRDLLNDEAFQSLAVSADRVQTRAPSPPRKTSKVMTRAQFERYQQEQKQRRNLGYTSDSDSSKSDAEEEDEEEEEEDDLERTRRLAKQRQRQEAQLSVYRQSMMKITGEQPLGPVPGSSSNNNLRASVDRGAGRLSAQPSMGSIRENALEDDEDEDDDVPLGILAAHGFPNKEIGRPPNHVRSGSAAGIQYNSETYPPPPPQSIAAGPAGGMGGGNLPAFARALPKDPFFGSSLVNQTDRTSFALGGGSPGSIYGGSNHSAPNLLPPPGGLIGVIASEERARAVRRGGAPANKNLGFGAQDPNGSMPLPLQMQPQIPASPMIVPPTPQQPTMEQQANIQMAQQMTQMMQMQMQWMQQIMAMQSGGGNMQQMQQMQQMMQQMQGMQGMPGAVTPPAMPAMIGMGGINTVGAGLQIPNQQQQQNFGFNGNNSNNNNNSSGRASTMMHPPNFNVGSAMGANQNGRAMSMMSTGFGGGLGGGPGPSYTPSIAPSERSIVGQPSRYRPVSTMPGANEGGSRSNSLTGRTSFGGWGADANRTSTMLERPKTSGGLSRNSNLVNVRLVETRAGTQKGDDEEDEAGWEEMRKKKESKRGLWRLKKGQGKENVSPNPSVSSSGNSPRSSTRGGKGPVKVATASLPLQHQQQQEETGFEDVYIPDLDRL